MANFKNVFERHLRALAEQEWADKVRTSRYPFNTLGDFPADAEVTTDIEATLTGCETCGQWSEVEINVEVNGYTVATFAKMSALFAALDEVEV